MIKFVFDGDIFDSTADALVNPVNCAGTLGKGLAKSFKKHFPDSEEPYLMACDSGELKPGNPVIVQSAEQTDLLSGSSPVIVLFPTKDHWRGRSRLKWIDAGLESLRIQSDQRGLRSIAMPALGCGLGGLQWADVKELMVKHFADADIEVEVYVHSVHHHGERDGRIDDPADSD